MRLGINQVKYLYLYLSAGCGVMSIGGIEYLAHAPFGLGSLVTYLFTTSLLVLMVVNLQKGWNTSAPEKRKQTRRSPQRGQMTF